MKRGRKLGFSAALLLSLAMVLAACGSGGTGSTGGSTGTNSGTPAASESGGNTASSGGTYVVGVPVPMSGSSAAMGTDIFQAIELAADQANANGGVNGQQIKLQEEDAACDPQTATNAANKLVSQSVKAIVGGYCSGSVQPAEPIYSRAGLPFVIAAANSSALGEGGFNDVFMVNSNGQAQAQTAADFLVKVKGAKNITLIDDQSAYGTNLAQLTAKAIQGDGGTVVATQAVDPKSQDFSALIAKLKAKNPDAIYWTGYYAQGGLLIKQARAAGYKGVIMVGDGSVDKTLIDTAGSDAAEGVYATMSPLPKFLTGDKATKFISDYKAKYSTDPGPYSALAFDAMNVLIAAAQKAGSNDPAKVIAALHSIDYQGSIGDIQFQKNGWRENAKFLVLLVKDGDFTRAPNQP